MSFIETTEKATPPLANLHTQTGFRIHQAPETGDTFFELYEGHPRLETMKLLWEQHKLTNYQDIPLKDLFSIFYDYLTITHLRDEEYENLIKLTWATKKKITAEAVGCYRCFVSGKEFLKYAAKLSTPDKHDIIFDHIVTNYGFNTLPSFKRSWDKESEQFIESLEQISQQEVWSIPFNPANLKALPVTESTRFYLIEWDNNRRKLRITKEQFYNDEAQTIIAFDRTMEKERVTKIPSAYQ